MDAAFYEDDKHDQASSRAAFGRLLPLLKPHLKALLGCFGLLVVSKFLYLWGPPLVRHAIDTDIAGGDVRGLIITVAGYVLIQGVFLIANYVFRVRMETIGQMVITKLRTRLFDHVVNMAISFFDRHPVGRLMARVESDTEALRMLFTNTVVTIIGSVLLIAGMFVWMIFVSPTLALIVAAFIPLTTAGLYLYHRLTTPRWFLVRKRAADLMATMTELLQGMQVVQIFDQALAARRRLFEASRRKYLPDLQANLCTIALFNGIFLLESVIIASVLYVGARLAGVGGITLGTLVMFISYVRMLMEPVHMAAEQLAVIQKAIAGAKRIFELLEIRESIPDPIRPVEWPNLFDSIVFDKVWFSYTNDGNFALRDISLTLPKGQRYALVGVTGGGKSTVINLLLRFYDPQKGRILVDGIDIREISQASLRSRIGLVLQDIFIFPGNVAANVTLTGDGYDRQKMEAACRMVSADRFIERMPNAYETELAERGANLSRGERQLLSFARALAFDPQILILDEATSSVDPETERLIQEGLATLMKGRTSIVIAHRLSTILNVDQILVIRQGSIIERGNHQALMAANGYYSKLFKLQFKQNNSSGVRKAC